VLDRGRVIDRDAEGNPLKVYGTHLDITKRKHFQFELLANQEKYKSLADNTSDVVALFDREFNIEYISPSVNKVLGYDVAHFVEFNALSRVHPDDHQILLDIFVEIESGVNEFTREYRIYRADDQMIWIQTRTKVIRDDKGDVLNVLTSSNDITSKKTAEELLKESNDQLKSAVETADLGIWHANLKNNIYNWNKEFCAIFDLTQDDFHDNREVWRALIVEEDRDKTNEALNRLIKGEPVKELRFRILTRVNTLKHILASGYPTMDEKGEPESFIGILSDVSRLVKQEEITQRALDDKNTLFKELHHRIKNNLQLVSSIIHLESRRLNNEVVNRFVKETNSRLLSMAQIHEQLLKIEEVDQLNIATYLESLVKDLMKGYADKETKYKIDLSIPSIQMHIDKVLAIGLIVNEALSNTIKYAYKDAKDGHVEIKMSEKKDRFHLLIGDSGVGMKDKQGNKDSLGIQLIFALVKQLDGRCELNTDNGVSYQIEF
jgi:PAS domain S-box-containing protein